MCKNKLIGLKNLELNSTARKVLRFKKNAFKVFNIQKSYAVFASICHTRFTKYAFFFPRIAPVKSFALICDFFKVLHLIL